MLKRARIIVLSTLMGVGLALITIAAPASAHTAQFAGTAVCQDDGTWTVTYDGTTSNVPEQGDGHNAELTAIVTGGGTVSPTVQNVIGNTAYQFVQSGIPGATRGVSATASFKWGDGHKEAPTADVRFSSTCDVPVPPTDYCPDDLNPGVQPEGTVCITPPVDLCPDVEDVQSEYPYPANEVDQCQPPLIPPVVICGEGTVLNPDTQVCGEIPVPPTPLTPTPIPTATPAPQPELAHTGPAEDAASLLLGATGLLGSGFLLFRRRTV